MLPLNFTKIWSAIRSRIRPETSGWREPGLQGAPVRPRIKTYSANSGRVYRYVYKGRKSGADSIDYVFTASDSPSEWRLVEIQILGKRIQEWEQQGGYHLTGTETYAVAKMTLFRFFDEATSLENGVRLVPALTEIGQYLKDLDIA